jgi:hypothetical protein
MKCDPGVDLDGSRSRKKWSQKDLHRAGYCTSGRALQGSEAITGVVAEKMMGPLRIRHFARALPDGYTDGIFRAWYLQHSASPPRRITSVPATA